MCRGWGGGWVWALHPVDPRRGRVRSRIVATGPADALVWFSGLPWELLSGRKAKQNERFDYSDRGRGNATYATGHHESRTRGKNVSAHITYNAYIHRKNTSTNLSVLYSENRHATLTVNTNKFHLYLAFFSSFVGINTEYKYMLMGYIPATIIGQTFLYLPEEEVSLLCAFLGNFWKRRSSKSSNRKTENS